MIEWLQDTLVVQVAAFACVASAMLLAGGMFSRSDARVQDRLRSLDRNDARDDRSRDKQSKRISAFEQAVKQPELPELASHLAPQSERERIALQAQLMRAGYYRPISIVAMALVRLTCMVGPVVVGLTLGWLGFCNIGSGLLFGALVGGVGMMLPNIWLNSQIKKRQLRLRRALPDFLDLFIACTESGMTLQATIQLVTHELHSAHPELADEFAVCSKQVQFGHTIESAMRDLADRTSVEELRSLANFVHQTQRYGATVAGALETLADTLRTQRELRAEELAQKASVKILAPTLLFIFPSVFVVLAAPAAIKIHESFVTKGEATGNTPQMRRDPGAPVR